MELKKKRIPDVLPAEIPGVELEEVYAAVEAGMVQIGIPCLQWSPQADF